MSVNIEFRADVLPAQRGIQAIDRQMNGLIQSAERVTAATSRINFNGVNTRPAVSQVDTLTRSVQNLERQSTMTNRIVRSAFMSIGAAITGGMAVNTIAGFEYSMSRVAAVTRAQGENFDIMRESALEMGRTTEFTASQAADALTFLGMAGFEASEAVTALPQILDLATASGMDLARTADIASNVMTAFGVAAEDAATVTDVLAMASTRSNTNIEQLGTAIAYVGPIAAAVGRDINETAAAIGVLSNAGIQGSMAGTSLRRVMSALANTTPRARRALAEIGLTAEDVNPQTNDLLTIIQRLADHGLETGQAFTIFNDRGAPAVMALIDEVQELEELMGHLAPEEVIGATDRMAGLMRDNLTTDFRIFNSAVADLLITLGDTGILNGLRYIVRGATQVVYAFSNAVEVIRYFIEDMILVAQFLGYFGYRLLANSNILERMSSAFESLSVILQDINFTDIFDNFSLGGLLSLFERIKLGISRLKTVLVETITGLASDLDLAAVFSAMFNRATAIVAAFVDVVIALFQHLGTVLVWNSLVPKMIEDIVLWFAYLPVRAAQYVAETASAMISGFQETFPNIYAIFQAIDRALTLLIQSIKVRFNAAFALGFSGNEVIRTLSAVGIAVLSWKRGLMALGLTLLFVTQLVGVFTRRVSVLRFLFTSLKVALLALTFLPTLTGFLAGLISERTITMFSRLSNAVKQMVSDIQAAFSDRFSGVITVVANFVESVTNWFMELGRRLIWGSIVPEILKDIWESFKNFVRATLGVLVAFGTSVYAFFSNLWARLNALSIQGIFDSVLEFKDRAFSSAVNVSNDFTNSLIEIGQSASDAVVSGFHLSRDWLASLFRYDANVVLAIGTAIGALLVSSTLRGIALAAAVRAAIVFALLPALGSEGLRRTVYSYTSGFVGILAEAMGVQFSSPGFERMKDEVWSRILTPPAPNETAIRQYFRLVGNLIRTIGSTVAVSVADNFFGYTPDQAERFGRTFGGIFGAAIALAAGAAISSNIRSMLSFVATRGFKAAVGSALFTGLFGDNKAIETGSRRRLRAFSLAIGGALGYQIGEALGTLLNLEPTTRILLSWASAVGGLMGTILLAKMVLSSKPGTVDLARNIMRGLTGAFIGFSLWNLIGFEFDTGSAGLDNILNGFAPIISGGIGFLLLFFKEEIYARFLTPAGVFLKAGFRQLISAVFGTLNPRALIARALTAVGIAAVIRNFLSSQEGSVRDALSTFFISLGATIASFNFIKTAFVSLWLAATGASTGGIAATFAAIRAAIMSGTATFRAALPGLLRGGFSAFSLVSLVNWLRSDIFNFGTSFWNTMAGGIAAGMTVGGIMGRMRAGIVIGVSLALFEAWNSPVVRDTVNSFGRLFGFNSDFHKSIKDAIDSWLNSGTWLSDLFSLAFSNSETAILTAWAAIKFPKLAIAAILALNITELAFNESLLDASWQEKLIRSLGTALGSAWALRLVGTSNALVATISMTVFIASLIWQFRPAADDDLSDYLESMIATATETFNRRLDRMQSRLNSPGFDREQLDRDIQALNQFLNEQADIIRDGIGSYDPEQEQALQSWLDSQRQLLRNISEGMSIELPPMARPEEAALNRAVQELLTDLQHRLDNADRLDLTMTLSDEHQNEIAEQVREMLRAAGELDITINQELLEQLGRALDRVLSESVRSSLTQINYSQLGSDAGTQFGTSFATRLQQAVESTLSSARRGVALSGSPAGVVEAATGGYISGAGGPRSDSIPAMLSNGEFVINAEATRRNYALLNAINSGQMPGFANGGLVGSVPSDVSRLIEDYTGFNISDIRATSAMSVVLAHHGWSPDNRETVWNTAVPILNEILNHADLYDWLTMAATDAAASATAAVLVNKVPIVGQLLSALTLSSMGVGSTQGGSRGLRLIGGYEDINSVISDFLLSFEEGYNPYEDLVSLRDTYVSSPISRVLNSIMGYANGGYISGAGGPRSDSIPAMLSNGEYVVNAAATRKFAPLLEKINSGQVGRFSGGGGIGNFGSGGAFLGEYQTNLTVDGLHRLPGVLQTSVRLLQRWTGETESLNQAIWAFGGAWSDWARQTEAGTTATEAQTATRSVLEEAERTSTETTRALTEAQREAQQAAEDWARQLREAFAPRNMRELALRSAVGFRDEFQSGLLSALTGEKSFEEFGKMLIDKFTMSILDAFVTGFTDMLFSDEGLGLTSIINDFFTSLGQSFTQSATSLVSGSAESPGLLSTLGDIFKSLMENLGKMLRSVLSIFGFADGGYVSGKGGPRSDSIPAMLSNGEYVINAESTRQFRPLIEAINSGSIPPGFAKGGLVGSETVVSLSSAPKGGDNSTTEVNLSITGDISRQTKQEVRRMIPEIAMQLDTYRRDRNR
jgi:TP901 family phage tail tape measure protein